MITATVLGHRPIHYPVSRYWKYDKAIERVLAGIISDQIDMNNIGTVVSNFNVGIDLAACIAAAKCKIDLKGILPYSNMQEDWGRRHQLIFAKALIYSIQSGGLEYNTGRMISEVKIERARSNSLDISDVVICLWRGEPGHVLKWMNYAKVHDKKIINVWDLFVKKSQRYTEEHYHEEAKASADQYNKRKIKYGTGSLFSQL